MFIHEAGPQALVQYSILYDCIRAKGELEKFTYMLNGRRYSFEVQFSKLRELRILKNNNYSRDFSLFPMEALPDLLDVPLTPRPGSDVVSIESPAQSLSSSPSAHDSLSTDTETPYAAPAFSLYPPPAFAPSLFRPAPAFARQPDAPFTRADFYRPGDLFPPALRRHDSDMSLLSSASLRRRDSDMSLLSTSSSLAREPTPFTPPFSEPRPLLGHASLLGTQQAMRRYTLEGFGRMVPISDLVDFLYGIDIKFAEYKSEFGGYSVVILGKSEWSDAMLVGYLNSNPFEGKVIRLRESSEVVSC